MNWYKTAIFAFVRQQEPGADQPPGFLLPVPHAFTDALPGRSPSAGLFYFGGAMPRFSRTSRERLGSCHPDLQRLFAEVVRSFDCSILCGHRSKAEQQRVFEQGLSQVRFPHSKHNTTPSRAVDVAPYPIDWQDRERFVLFAGFVLGTARQMFQRGEIDHVIRWGGDWDSDTKTADERFRDLPHFELGQMRQD